MLRARALLRVRAWAGAAGRGGGGRRAGADSEAMVSDDTVATVVRAHSCSPVRSGSYDYAQCVWLRQLL